MAAFRYVVADVFTDRPLEGNPLAVFTDARGIPEPLLQPLARELCLSETVFCYTPERGGHVRIRIFTPDHELPFAGHPVLGSAFVLAAPLQLTEITLETGATFLLAPLIQIAWAEGKVTEPEREAVLAIAGECGIRHGTPAYAKAVEWLRERPSDALFDTSIEALKAGLSVLTPEERAERVKRIVDYCRRVASASGGGLARVLGLSSGVSQDEESLIDAIGKTLRAP